MATENDDGLRSENGDMGDRDLADDAHINSKEEAPLTRGELNKILDGFRNNLSRQFKKYQAQPVPGADALPRSESKREGATEFEASIRKDLETLKQREAKVRSKERNSAIREALVSKGVSAHAVHMATKIVDEHVAFQSDDSEQLVWKDGENELDLATGVELWAKSKDARIFLTPKNAAGSESSPNVSSGKVKSDKKADLSNESILAALHQSQFSGT